MNLGMPTLDQKVHSQGTSMPTLDLWTKKSTANEPHHAHPGPESPQATPTPRGDTGA